MEALDEMRKKVVPHTGEDKNRTKNECALFCNNSVVVINYSLPILKTTIIYFCTNTIKLEQFVEERE